MTEELKEVLTTLAPYVAGLVSSGFLSAFAVKIIYGFINKKISSVAPTEQYKELTAEIKKLKEEVDITNKEIMQLRGKRK